MKIGSSQQEGREPFPPYAFIPGGPWPHPTRSPLGHSHDRARLEASPIEDDLWQASNLFLRGVELFNAGYYWESHEYWEALWHAHGRKGPTAVALQGLIKLAAAGVKVREQKPRGVSRLALRAVEHFEWVTGTGRKHILGLNLDEWIEHAKSVAVDPPEDPSNRLERVVPVFAFRLEPSF